ncbi:uncharacterized protein LOC122504283 [Leptopilina heterotoma]|uniref:uncharacterized protein LOC122504283 n=1 Tax=Leptopilina heterotoma TaxID=63436 RepID=UPI001CA96BFF|nr:uncharacterized protein LOC122504283 [Leptopilina heterotoma]
METSATNSSRLSEGMTLTRKDIFYVIKDNINKDNNFLLQLLEEHLSQENKFTLCTKVKTELRKLFSKFRQKFEENQRVAERFLKNNDSWLAVQVNLCGNSKDIEVTEEPQPSSSTKTGGRPSSTFEDGSDRSKRRKSQEIREKYSTDELAYATQMSLRASGKWDTARLVQDVCEGSPTKATRYRQSLLLSENSEKQMTKEVALSIVIENQLSKNMYNGIRSNSIRHLCKLYPSYKNVLQAKKECYPSCYDLSVTECKAEVKLQALLDHTVQRILLVQNDVIQRLPQNDVKNLHLICKWGCDGTSAQSRYKQKFDDDIDANKTDSNIFFTSLVPLQLFSVDQSGKSNVIIWKNPRPSSPRYCRPIRIEFLKETPESTKAVVENISEQERNLTPLQIIIDAKEINVDYKLALTMVDGKVCNSLTSTSSAQKCYLCQSTSKEFNNIDAMLKKVIVEDNLQFGLSSLHAWIRLFECLLHIAYKLEVKTWQKRKVDQESISIRKANIQKGFREQLGLLIDQPKQGFGNTNDGNTARSFFQNSTISATITGINETLIKRFHVILQVISCGFQINVPEYEKYCLETARLYVHLYPWYYMPTTLHKILIHSAQIVETSLLPIGQMSEEAQESCNKFIKKYRQDFARKTSRAKNMEDIFCRLLVSSDPLISSLRKLPTKKLKTLESDAINLLKAPTPDDTNLYTNSPSSSEDESEHSSDDEY